MTTFFSLNDLGLAASSGQLLSQWLTFMNSAFPGYTPSSGNLEYIMAVIFAAWAADVNTQASLGSAELFKQFGQQLMNVQPENGSLSSAVVTVVAVDQQGYTLPAGTQFLLDDAFGFAAVTDITIPAGDSFGTGTIQAVSPGSSFNGAGSALGAQLNQQLNWVLSVNLVAPASGGADPETEEAYLNRLATTLTLMAPRPITAADYGIFSLNFQPQAGTDQQEVGRAIAIDGYDADPASPTYDTYHNERMVAVAIADASGNALNSDTLAAVEAWLEGLRELNFIVNVTSPNYSPVYVACSVVRTPAFDVATVQSNISQALTDLLSPDAWGLPSPGGAGWVNQPTVYYSKIDAAVQGASGVDHIVSGTLGVGFQAGPTGASDLLLPGPFPLPTTSDGQTVPLTAFTVTT